MLDFLVHTIRKNSGIHFFYRVKAGSKDSAFSKLSRRGAIDPDEDHYETIQIPQGGDEFELIAIVQENKKSRLN